MPAQSSRPSSLKENMVLQLVSVIQKIWSLIEDAIKRAAPSEVLELELYWSLTQISETVYKIVYIPTRVSSLRLSYRSKHKSATRYSHLISLYDF